MIALIDEIMVSKEKSSAVSRANSRTSQTHEGRGEVYHEPVLLEEVISVLRPVSGKKFFDGTFGGGGHSEALIEREAAVVAFDQDPDAIQEASGLLERYSGKLILVQSNFSDAARYFQENNFEPFDGILLDLGVSSHQLDTAERGFSFQSDGPLDMRMNPARGRSVAEIVNEDPEEELARIFFEYGEESAARKIANRIVCDRDRKRITTTGELVKIVSTVVPKRGPKNPATKVFQALRIAANDELGVLRKGLQELKGWLNPGGRFAIITFHSLEDRIVKHFFREVSQEWIDRPEWPEPQRNPEFGFRLITNRPITATEREQRQNPRSRSAKLRVVERMSL
jgi:16S rRNA (cytosine1402-N4)-methyltransferase